MKTCAQCQIKYPDALDYCPQDGAALPLTAQQTQAQNDPYLGTTVDGRYLIESRLGEGGMGVVYAGRHVIIDKRVAIKVLRREAQEEETAAERFIQEAKSASKIGHANIVDITDFGVLPDGSAYFVMEFLEGQTLGKALESGPLEPARVATVAAQMARGLHAAHGKGIVHRDLKPDNIFLLERDGQSDVVKIVDFGIAKVQQGGALGGQTGRRLTQVGMVLGTPEYMSPEQATGKETDHRVDEYALGCMMYEMLTGEVPYKSDSSAGTLTKHVFDPIVPPSKKRPDLVIPPALEAVCVRAMAKKPDERYPSMRELLEALDVAGTQIIEYAGGRGAQIAAERQRDRARDTVVAEAPRVGRRPSSSTDLDQIPRRSKAPMVAALGAFVLVGVGVGGYLGWSKRNGAEASVPAANLAPTNVVAPSANGDRPSAAGTGTQSKPVGVVSAPVGGGADPAPATVTLTLRTTPPDAEVLVGPEVIGRTPFDFKHALSNAPVVFAFRKDGYERGERQLIPNENRDVEVALKRKERDRHSLSGIEASRSPGSRRVGSESSLGSPDSLGAPARNPPKGKASGELRDPF